MSDSVIEDFVEDRVITQAMRVQLGNWKSKFDLGHKRVGWKIGFNAQADQERMKLALPIVGFLTSESVCDPGSIFKGVKTSKLMVEAEVAILIAQDVAVNASNAEAFAAIKGFAPAIEIVDFARVPHNVRSIVEDNIFHEAVIFGELCTDTSDLMVKDISASVLVNGENIQTGDSSRYPENFSDVVIWVANALAKQGECLQAGDWIIAGSITPPVEVHTDDAVEISLAPLGSLKVNISKEL